MNATATNVTSITDDSTDPDKPANQRPKQKRKAKPVAVKRPALAKYLPTDRITFSRQLDLLRAYAAASGPMNKIASNNAVAEIVDMKPSTVSIANAFFVSAGFLQKAEGGYLPAQEVIAFLRNFEWNPETAAYKLAPLVEKTWFAEELLSKLAFGPMTEDACIQDLADEAKAGPDYRNQLRMLLEYLIAAGLVQRDGTMLKKGTASATSTSDASPSKQESPSAVQEPPKSMTPSLFGTTEGAVNFNVSVRVDMGEFANWKPERIAAFFNGMAQVLAAKAAIEKAE